MVSILSPGLSSMSSSKQGQHTQSHAHRHVGVLHHLLELLEADLAVLVLIRLHDRLVDNLAHTTRQQSQSRVLQNTLSIPSYPILSRTHLLQLLVLQIAPDHHLEHDEQLAIANVAVAIDVVDLERKAQLVLLVALAAESAEPVDEFLEIDVSAAVLIEDRDHACRQRVGGDLGELQEFFALDCARAVLWVDLLVGSPRVGLLGSGWFWRRMKGVLCRVS